MSKRAIRKYEAMVAEKVAAERASASGDNDDAALAPEKIAISGNGPVNMFSMLLGDEGDGDAEDVEEAESSIAGDTPPLPSEQKEKSGSKGKMGSGNGDGGGKRRRKKGKKKSRKDADDEDWFVGDTGTTTSSAGDTAGLSTDSPDDIYAIPNSFFLPGDDDDLRSSARSILSEVIDIAYPDGIIPGELEALAAASRALVAVNPIMLSAETELKRLFGSRVVETERVAEDVEESQQRRRVRGQTTRVKRKTTHLVQPRETWWPSAPGLGMVIDDSAPVTAEDDLSAEDGQQVRFFRYNHERRYQTIQGDFQMVVGTHNPQLLVELLNRAPYHVDTLLQLGEVHRQTGELDQAGELVQRALYVLESTWTRAFKPFNGSCRLRYAVPENRSLFLALFRHVQLLAHRGLHRTALEAAKLYLNLDPPFDPLGALLVVDSLGLLSGEYGWVRAMHRDYVPSSLELFPNFVVSAIIAEHCQAESRAGSRKGTATSSSKKKKKKTEDRTIYVASKEELERTPLQKLTSALLSFPMLAIPLLNATKESTEICERYEIFGSSTTSAMDSDGMLFRISRIYAESSKAVWKGSSLQLLKDAIILAGSAAAGGRGEEGLALMAEAQELREDAASFFRRTKVYDQLLVGDFAGSGTNVPAELMAPHDVGPQAPPQGFHVPAPAPGIANRATELDAGNGNGERLLVAPVERTVSTTEAAVAFFRSLLPWYTPDAEELATPVPTDQLEEGTSERLQETLELQRDDGTGGQSSGDDA